MSTATYEHEMHEHEGFGESFGEAFGEGFGEAEAELAHELGLHEHEHEAEHEAEQFFGRLAGLAARAIRSPALRKIGMKAARAAVSGLGDVLFGQEEADGAHEFEAEVHEAAELSPLRRVYPDAMLEHMAHMASMAETEHEAAELMLPVVPTIAAELAPLEMMAGPSRPHARPSPAHASPRHASPARPVAHRAPVTAHRPPTHPAPHRSAVGHRAYAGVMRAAPALTRGVANITRTLHRNPVTRPLVRVIPTIARRTAAQIARTAARGHRVTPRTAVRILAHQTARTLCKPGHCVHAYRRARGLDRKLHRVHPQLLRHGHRRRVGYPGWVRPRYVGGYVAPSATPIASTVPVAAPGAAPAVYAPPATAAPGVPSYAPQSHVCTCVCRCPRCGGHK